MRSHAIGGGAGGDPPVSEYMTREVATVAPGETVAAVATRIAESAGHSGYPVADGDRVVGFVSARDLLLAADDAPISAVMSEDLLVAAPEMSVTDAGRVILRSGVQRLPVVDGEGLLVGIISNADVVRSQIERADPEKVEKLRRTLASIHDVGTARERRTVDLEALHPTQERVYAGELEGRQYELQRGLAEPLVVVDNAGQLVLADGHHRVLAARRLGIEEMDAYVIALGSRVDLGMVETAREAGLRHVEDVSVVDYARHPLVETTQRLQ